MSQHCVQCSGVQGCGPTWDRAWAQGVLPPRVFAWLWQARVRAMLRRRERHVCKLQTVSAVMARPRPRRPMLTPLGRPEPSETLTGLHGMPGQSSGVIVVSARQPWRQAEALHGFVRSAETCCRDRPPASLHRHGLAWVKQCLRGSSAGRRGPPRTAPVPLARARERVDFT